MHVKSDHSLIEIIGNSGENVKPVEVGQIVGTGFGNYATPLIRYATSDSAQLPDQHCNCGRPGPIIEELSGRVEDIVVTPEGRHVGRLDHIFKDTLNISEGQIIQKDIKKITVNIVKRPEFCAQDMKILEEKIRTRLGSTIKINYKFMEKIPRLPSGKFHFVISEVNLKISGAKQTSKKLNKAEHEEAQL